MLRPQNYYVTLIGSHWSSVCPFEHYLIAEHAEGEGGELTEAGILLLLFLFVEVKN